MVNNIHDIKLISFDHQSMLTTKLNELAMDGWILMQVLAIKKNAITSKGVLPNRAECLMIKQFQDDSPSN